MPLHLIKVAVGAETVDDLCERQKAWLVEDKTGKTVFRVHTRQTPRRQEELFPDSSLYWIIKGFIRARQQILAFEPTTRDGRDMLLIHLDPTVVITQLVPRGPHQGWRYLKDFDAPPDVEGLESNYQEMPAKLLHSLRELALI
ncbi:MAG: DUF1489 domain-containing protein [Pseudomonadota bacterium]